MVKRGYLGTRYRGLVKNAFDFAMHAVAYNDKRSFSLCGFPLTVPRKRPDKPGMAQLLGLAAA